MVRTRARLLHLLAERGWGSRKWLAAEMGVERMVLYRWLNGLQPWPAERRAQVAAIFDVPESELFEEG